MNLDELKNRISKLDDILDKTNKEVKIDIAKSKTAQTQLLAKFRMVFVSCLIFALIFTLMVIGGVAPRKFPMELNIGIIVFALIAVSLFPAQTHRRRDRKTYRIIQKGYLHAAVDDFLRSYIVSRSPATDSIDRFRQ